MAKAKTVATSKGPVGPVTLASDPTTVIMPTSLIVVDAGFNARKQYTEIKGLAKTIDKEGQMSPVEVRRMDDGKFRLLSGYRRYYAITWPEDKGGLGRDVIRATILDAEEGSDIEDRYRNVLENVQRENLTPYELAMACKGLSDSEEEASGKDKGGNVKVANRLGKSASYVGNLIRCVEGLSPVLIERWKLEHSENPPKLIVCSTDWLVKLSKLTSEEQEIALRRQLGETVEDGEGGEGGGGGEDDGEEAPEVARKRPTMKVLKAALAAAWAKKKGKGVQGVKNAEELVRVNGIIDALKFAIGTVDIIKGVYVGEEDAGEE